MEQIYTPKQNFKVLVNCMTYNQSRYIEDALNGFAMQKTDFPFICLVMDDCSTDGEQEVIKGWMERECDMIQVKNIEIENSFVTIVPHKSNSNCTFVFYFLKENLFGTGDKKMYMITPWREHCEYEAICEGDDYWTDELKLQKQADFLGFRQEYSMCFCDVQTFNQDTNTKEGCQSLKWFSANSNMPVEKKELFYYIMEGKCRIQTLSVMYRINLLAQIPKDEHRFMMGDTCLWLNLSQLGPIHYLPDCVGVYRVHKGSASHNKKTHARFFLSMFEMRVYYCNKYNYEVSKYVVKRYNEALFKFYCSNPSVSDTPLFSAFSTNLLQDYILANPKICRVLGRIINVALWFRYQK